MNKVDCDIVRDLLPGYSDKILSEASNKLVREHLQTCDSCLKEFQEMNKEIPPEIIKNQDEPINYLKGFKKNKIKSIIFAIITTINVLVIIFLMLYIYDSNAIFIYPIDELTGEIIEQYDEIEEKKYWNICINNIKYNFNELEKREIQRDDGGKEIHIRFGGAHRIFGYDFQGTRTNFNIEIDESLDKIYVENIKGDLKEVWNKSNGIIQRKPLDSI